MAKYSNRSHGTNHDEWAKRQNEPSYKNVTNYSDYDHNRNNSYASKEHADYRRLGNKKRQEVSDSRRDAVINAKQTPRNANNLYQEKKKSNGTYAEKMQSDTERSKEILGNAFAQKARKDYEGVPARKAAYQAKEERGRQLKEDARRQERKAVRDDETFMEMRQRRRAKPLADRAGGKATLTAEWKRTMNKRADEAKAQREKEEQEAAARKKRLKTAERRQTMGVRNK